MIASEDKVAIAQASPWPLSLAAVWYFTGGHRKDVRAFVTSLFDEFVQQNRNELRWTLEPASNRFAAIAGSPAQVEPLANVPEAAGWRRGVRNGATADAADIPLLDASGMHDWGARLGRAGHVELAVAPTEDNVREFPDLFKRIAIGLDAASGHASLALTLPPDQKLGKHAAAIYQLMQRYPGLDLFMPEKHVAFVESTAIRSVGWLTWVGHDLVGKLAPDVRANPPPEVHVEYLPEGMVVRAGDAPSLGTDGNPPAPYVAAGRWLGSLRAKDSAPLSTGADGEFSAAETEAWLARFD